MLMRTKITGVMLSVILGASVLSGCGGGASKNEQSGKNEASSTGNVKVKVFKTHLGKGKLPDSNDANVKYVLGKTGIEYQLLTTPNGADPTEGMNVMIASGDMPDIMRPIGGVEQTLIKQGGALPLDDLLPKYAPHVWERIPKEAWDVVRTASPDGKIYYIPKIFLIPERVPMVRKDWMDNVGITSMPKTKDEYVQMLTAFRDKDPNKNGKKDDIPTSGRELGAWMDHLFAMYGVAMWEGKPEWDVYEGQLQYAGVTKNARASIAFIRDLYANKLLDNETFLNKGDVWTAKINNNLVGNWYHLPTNLKDKIIALKQATPNAMIAGMPLPKVDGFEGYVTQKSMGEPEWLIPKKAEKNAANSLKLLDFYYDPANDDFVRFGIEGAQHEVVNGKKRLLPMKDDMPIPLVMINFNTKETMNDRIDQTFDPDQVQMVRDIFDVGIKDAKRIAGDGMPNSVYDGFPDIKGHKLYQEMLAKIVIGEWPIEKFDEYVEKWKKSGGDTVTKRAQEWYAKVQSYNTKK